MRRSSCPYVRAYRLPKHGEPDSSCQDAFGIAPFVHTRRAASARPRSMAAPLSLDRANGAMRRQVWAGVGHRLRLAVADGATTTACSGPWAETLATAAVKYPAPWEDLEIFPARMRELRRAWAEQARASLPASIPWYAQTALDGGAFSTVVRVAVLGRGWEADGWGDSCLFHVRQGRPIQILPPMGVDDFAAAPCMVASVPGKDGHLREHLFSGSGILEQGDVLLLATDALACWLIDQGTFETSLEELLSMDGRAAFASWVEDKRKHHGMKNDDTTLVLAEFP